MMQYSVIVPVYNGEETLGRCLEALLDQSVSPSEYEIVVVDDGSGDTTAQIAAAYEVRYLHQANKGPASARNRGAFSARGEVILFTDCDCIPDHNWIEEMARPFSETDVSGVKGAYKTCQKSLTARFAQAEFDDRFRLLQKADRIDMVDTYSAAFRKSVFIQAGGFDASFPHANNEDTDFSYRLAAAGHKLVFNPYACVYHRHPDSLTKYLKIKFWRGYWRIVVYARYPDKMAKDSYTPYVIKFQALAAAVSLILLPLWPISPLPRYAGVFLAGGILFSALPFSVASFKTDRTVGILSPVYVFLRAFVFAAGSMRGCFRVVFKSGRLNRKPSGSRLHR